MKTFKINKLILPAKILAIYAICVYFHIFKITSYFSFKPFSVSPSYLIDATVFPLMSMALIQVVSKHLNCKGLKLFDKRIGQIYIAKIGILISGILFRQILRWIDIPIRRVNAQLILLFGLMFAFVVQSMIIDDMGIKEAFINNFKLVKKKILWILAIFIPLVVMNLFISNVSVDLHVSGNYVKARYMYLFYSSFKFVGLEIIMTLIYIKDKKSLKKHLD